MDAVQRPEARPWIDMQPVNIKEFIRGWIERKQALAAASKQLSKSASPSFKSVLLDCAGDDTIAFDSFPLERPLPDDANQLETVKARRATLQKMRDNRSYAADANRRSRYRHLQAPVDKYTLTVNSKPDVLSQSIAVAAHGTVLENEALITVQVLRPGAAFGRELSKTKMMIPDQEIVLLSSQTLAELKDAIACVSDVAEGDQQTHYTSSFIFINDCFYNDCRKDTNIDYSE